MVVTYVSPNTVAICHPELRAPHNTVKQATVRQLIYYCCAQQGRWAKRTCTPKNPDPNP